jgi:hypothetical protein
MLSFLSFAKTMTTNVTCQAFDENVVNQLFVESLFRIRGQKCQILVEDSWLDNRLFFQAWMHSLMPWKKFRE